MPCLKKLLFLMVNLLCDITSGQESKCSVSKFKRKIPVAVVKELYNIKVGTEHNEIGLPLDTATLEKLIGNSSKCGRPVVDATKFVISGADAPEKAWPWQVVLRMTYLSKTTHCGGSLISKTWVLTAAHCVNEAATIVILLGLRNRSNTYNDSNVQFRKPAKIIAHPYLDLSKNNDIALVKLNQDADMTDYVSPVCLPSDGQDFENENACYTTGWGDGHSGKDVLQQVNAQIMPQSLCMYSWSVMVKTIDGRRMCLDLRNDLSGPCYGDSGGPLSCKVDGKFVLAGVGGPAAFDCSYTHFPAAFVRVSEYLNWIVTHVKDN